MVAIELRFLAGRWHATPWGRHVNEGAVEWPPSPWRLLRALLATWHDKCAEIPEDEMRALVHALTSPPEFYLPAAAQAHTRHFMPVANDNRAKVFDTFVTLASQEPVVTAWPQVELTEPQRAILARLLGCTTYFGRAESWVAASLLDCWQGMPNCLPVNGKPLNVLSERVQVLAAVSPAEHASWRAVALADRERKLGEKQRAAVRKGKSPDGIRLSKKDETALVASLPATVFDALHTDTSSLRSAGWSRPPGSTWVAYNRPADAFVRKPQLMVAPRKARKPTVARFVVCGNVRPRLTEALWVGERVRIFAMSHSRKIRQEKAGNEEAHASEVFSGKHSDGSFRMDGHVHAHFLCEAAIDDGRISHLNVFAPMGFSSEDELALHRLRMVWGHGGHDLQFVLVGVGYPADFGGLNEKAGQSPILGQSAVWVSRTPFVLTRHLKVRRSERRDREKLVHATVRELRESLRKEMERRDWLHEHLDALVSVEPVLDVKRRGTMLGGHFTSWLKFRRERQRGYGCSAGTLGYGFRLVFRRSVQGPIVLGYGCHFGLGQFAPEK